jgi:hypothetical protein
MNVFCSRLADFVRHGTPHHSAAQQKGRRPQIETLEERAVPTVNLPTNPFLFTPIDADDHHHLAVHMQARLEIFLDGQQLAIPANVGVFGDAEYPLHTHNDSGRIDIESPTKREFDLEDFLAVWNTTAQGHAALAKLAAADDITVMVNGKARAGLDDIELHNHDTIIIIATSSPASPVLTPNQLFVTQVYADLLHRAPDATGLAAWTADLNQGMSRTQVVQNIEANAECFQVEVQDLYRTLLHRTADASGLAGFVSFLSGGGTIAQVESTILGSQEFLQNAGGTNGGFITALYQDVLQRQPDAAGAAGWQAALAAGSTRAQLAGVFLQSQEAETVMLQAMYQDYLHRPADNTGLANFLSMLQQGGTREQVLAAVMGSQEYFNGGVTGR